jgi:hypothetical protein
VHRNGYRRLPDVVKRCGQKGDADNDSPAVAALQTAIWDIWYTPVPDDIAGPTWGLIRGLESWGEVQEQLHILRLNRSFHEALAARYPWVPSTMR